MLAWVAGHADWILRKQRDFATREPRTPPLDYVDGETHLYLGREVRLTIEHGEREGVRLELSGGRLVVTLKPAAAVPAAVEEPGGQLPLPLTGDGSERVKELLDVWYLRRAKRELPARLQACWASFPSEGRAFPTLRVKRMRSRWGSMSPKGDMSLRADLVARPRRVHRLRGRPRAVPPGASEPQPPILGARRAAGPRLEAAQAATGGPAGLGALQLAQSERGRGVAKPLPAPVRIGRLSSRRPSRASVRRMQSQTPPASSSRRDRA